MMMTLKQRIRTFLGIDALPSRLEITEIRQILESNHLELKEILAKHVTAESPRAAVNYYQAVTRDWNALQLQELADMIANPPKED